MVDVTRATSAEGRPAEKGVLLLQPENRMWEPGLKTKDRGEASWCYPAGKEPMPESFIDTGIGYVLTLPDAYD